MARTYWKGAHPPPHPNVDWSRRTGTGSAAMVHVYCDGCQAWRSLRAAHVSWEIRREVFTGNCLKHRKLVGPRFGPYAPAVGVDYTAVTMLPARGGRERMAHVKTICVVCGAERWRVPSMIQDQLRRGTFTGMCRSCSSRATVHATSKGRHIDRKGYAVVTRRGVSEDLRHAFDLIATDRRENGRGKCIFEHTVVMVARLGRLLTRGETVHHINGRRSDNRPANLRLYKRGDHHPGYGDFYQEWQEALARIAYLELTHRQVPHE